MTASVKVLMLEASDVDNEGVAALVGVVREFRNGASVTSITQRLAEPLRAVEDAPPQLPAPKPRRTYKPRAPKAERQRVSTGHRAQGLTPAIIAAVKDAPQPDYNAIARKVYGNTEAATITKVKRAFWSLCDRGQLKKIGDDTYRVVS
jgi:hypothetical protein